MKICKTPKPIKCPKPPPPPFNVSRWVLYSWRPYSCRLKLASEILSSHTMRQSIFPIDVCIKSDSSDVNRTSSRVPFYLSLVPPFIGPTLFDLILIVEVSQRQDLWVNGTHFLRISQHANTKTPADNDKTQRWRAHGKGTILSHWPIKIRSDKRPICIVFGNFNEGADRQTKTKFFEFD